MERKFKVGDRVRVVKATFVYTEEHVGLVGVVVGFDRYHLGDGTYTEHDCPRVHIDDEHASYWHEPHGLELVETETPKPTPQKLNSQYLMHLAEVLTQAERSLADKAAECLDDPLEYYRWQSTREEVRSLAVKLEVRADDLDMQEAAQLSKAVAS